MNIVIVIVKLREVQSTALVLAVPGGAQLPARAADAPVAARCVDAAAAGPAEAGRARALVDVHALVAAGAEREALGTRAVEAARVVGAAAVRAHSARALGALVHVAAVAAAEVQPVAGRTLDQ